jgi:hypothetical protein
VIYEGIDEILVENGVTDKKKANCGVWKAQIFFGTASSFIILFQEKDFIGE